MAYNYNSFHPYVTHTPYSDNSNPVFYNMHQPHTPGWPYPNQYDPYPPSNNYNVQNNFNSSPSHWGFTYPESNFQNPCPQHSFPESTSYTPFSEPLFEEKSELQRSIEANLQQATQHFQKTLASPIPPYFQESYSVPPLPNEQPFVMETSKDLLCESTFPSSHIFDSHYSQNFRNQDSYTPILGQPFESQDESIESFKESMLQMQKDLTESFNSVREQLDNLLRNEETLSYQPLTNPVIPHSIDMTQDSCHFGNPDSISAHSPELVQTSNPIDVLASFPFSEIELEHEFDPELSFDDSNLLPDSIMTSITLPDFNPFPKSELDPFPIHCEIESPIFFDDHIELDQFYTSENSIDKLASSPHFIELHEECDLEPKLSDSILFPYSIMTPVSLPHINLFPESILDPFTIHNEVESSIFEDHIELAQFYTFEDSIDILASSPSCGIELNEKCDLDFLDLFTSETDCTILKEDVDLSLIHI